MWQHHTTAILTKKVFSGFGSHIAMEDVREYVHALTHTEAYFYSKLHPEAGWERYL